MRYWSKARHRAPPTEPTRSDQRRSLARWFGESPGRLVAAAEADVLGDVLPDLFGYYLLQIGRFDGVDWLGSSRILNRAVVDIDAAASVTAPGDAAAAKAVAALEPGSPELNARDLALADSAAWQQLPRIDQSLPSALPAERCERYPLVRGDADALPFDSDSVDVVLLPHTLEFTARPHDALREAQRVLVAEGHLVLCGFNPWSWLGCSARLPGRTVPWRAQWLTASRARDWLQVLGFELLSTHRCFYRPLLGRESLMAKLSFLERLGQRAGNNHLWALAQHVAGVYVIVARKRVTTLTPIRARWRPRARLAGVGLAGPSARREDAA